KLFREPSSMGRMGIVGRTVERARKEVKNSCGSSDRRSNQSTDPHLTRPGFIEGGLAPALGLMPWAGRQGYYFTPLELQTTALSGSKGLLTRTNACLT
ncbi:MAG: hypothetical protein M3Y84_07775, partial [Acidobacteriota bacterium]|nr:hypothetical protein [Acidobacteriota bacterium]